MALNCRVALRRRVILIYVNLDNANGKHSSEKSSLVIALEDGI